MLIKNYSVPRILLFTVTFFTLVLTGCKKDDVIDPSLSELPAFVNFSIESETQATVINRNAKTVSVKLGNLEDWSALKVNFDLSASGQVFFKNEALISGTSTLDLSKQVEIEVKSPDGTQSTTWKIEHTSALENYGLGKWLTSATSLPASSNFYFDQGGTGAYQFINCGPTVATMAIKWSDPAFSLTPLDAREAILPEGGWWYTNNIANYLNSYNISTGYFGMPDTLSDEGYAKRIKAIMDNGYAVIFCLDMYYVAAEPDSAKRVNKFYRTNAADWGHFILGRGYKEVDGKLWIDIYDPYSLGAKYTGTNQLKGESRYYDVAELKKGADIWWKYVMAVAPKGRTVSAISAVRPQPDQLIFHQRGGIRVQ